MISITQYVVVVYMVSGYFILFMNLYQFKTFLNLKSKDNHKADFILR